MNRILGAVLATLMALQTGLVAIDIDPTLRSVLMLAVTAGVAGVGAYLQPPATGRKRAQ